MDMWHEGLHFGFTQWNQLYYLKWISHVFLFNGIICSLVILMFLCEDKHTSSWYLTILNADCNVYIYIYILFIYLINPQRPGGKKKKRHIHTPPDPSFHPPILCSKLSKARVLQLCWRYFASDPRWKMENDTNRLVAIPRASSSHKKHQKHSSKIVGENEWACHRGVIPGWFHTTNAGFFWGTEVTQEFKVEYVALLRLLFITSFSLWMAAMKSRFLQWSRTNHYQLQLSWGHVGSSNKKKNLELKLKYKTFSSNIFFKKFIKRFSNTG